ncbi:MAG: hypothetical protein ACI4F7_03350 [Acutalibacteraceae bacterium]
MTFAMLLRTLFEIILFAAVVWACFHEDRLAAFEKRVFCAVKRRRLKVVGFDSAEPDIKVLRAKTSRNG